MSRTYAITGSDHILDDTNINWSPECCLGAYASSDTLHHLALSQQMGKSTAHGTRRPNHGRLFVCDPGRSSNLLRVPINEGIANIWIVAWIAMVVGDKRHPWRLASKNDFTRVWYVQLRVHYEYTMQETTNHL